MERERILSSEHTCRLHWLRAYTGLAAVSYPHLIARFHGYCHTWGETINNNKNNNKTNSKYYHPNRSAKIRPGEDVTKYISSIFILTPCYWKGSPLNIKVKGLCLWDGENFALSPRRLAIFLVMSSGVLQTYFFVTDFSFRKCSGWR